MNAYLVSYPNPTKLPSLIFADGIYEVATRNGAATKIEKIACWIIPGQGDKLP